MRIAILTASLLVLTLTRELSAADLTGRYESDCSEAERWSRCFRLSVKQSGSKAQVSFTAAFGGGHIAAPDGWGTGTVFRTGELQFHFEDSFSNEGTGKFERRGKAYVLTIHTTKVVEQRPLMLYEDPIRLMKKSSIPEKM